MQNMQHDLRCGAILCAAEEELAPFLPHLAEEQRLSRAMLTLHIGRIGGLRMVLAATGMCQGQRGAGRADRARHHLAGFRPQRRDGGRYVPRARPVRNGRDDGMRLS